MSNRSTSDVTIATGRLRGRVEDGVASFKGIPYAAPPVGDLRWRAPQPAEPWEGVRDCFEFGSDCLQPAGRFENIQTTPSEDCLYLNVWKPVEAGPGDGLPVLVWIHGGGYVGGGSSIPTYDGTAFARQGLVVVTFNYRLGRFGFFAHPAVIANAEDGVFGNYGYMDQIWALEWVRDNISQFGGDPGRVTIAGESAGGESVIQLLTSPFVDDGLFSQAIVLSGGGRKSMFNRPLEGGSLFNMSATGIDSVIGLRYGIRGDGPEALAALRALDANVLTGGQGMERVAVLKLFGGPLHGVPVIDGTIITGEPEDQFLAGTFKRVPIIIGTTAIDVPVHFPPDRASPLEWFGDDEAAARAAYGVPDSRFLSPERHIRLLLAVGADISMHEPAHFVASTMKEAGEPAWVYRFTYTAESARPDHMAQVHAGELPWMFDTLDVIYGDAVTEKDQAMATAFNTYLANFVKNGTPGGGELPAWPQVTPEEYNLMHFTLDDGPVFGPDPRPSVKLVARAQRANRD